MSHTIYKPGDTLYERTIYVDANHRAAPIVREWTVLSAVVDPLYLDEHGTPQQVVTLRAFTPQQALYQAEIARYLDINVSHGTWHRTEAEARDALVEQNRTWAR